MDALIRAINKYPNGTKLIIKYSGTFEIKGEIDTIYETNSDFEMDEEGYKEYYACVFSVLSIHGFRQKNSSVEVGDLIEISMQDAPLGVYLEDGNAVWEDGMN